MADPLLIAQHDSTQCHLLPGLANRHGLITGATGTGKTVTLQKMAESFANIGVPVFMADVKGDLSGVGAAGVESPKLKERLAALGTQFVDLPEGRLAGHTFHYSKSDTSLAPLVLAKTSDGRDGEAVYRQERLTASYVHFYFPSNPEAVAALFG